MKNIASIQVRSGEIRVEVEENVGPLGARRSRAAAESLLASFADVAEDADVVGSRVERLDDLDGSGSFWVASFEYDRAVRR